MTTIFGRRNEFAIEIGALVDGSDTLRKVDVWAGNRWLTCDDNAAYLSQFVHSVWRELNKLMERPRKVWGTRPFPHCTYAENHRLLLDIPEEIERDDSRRFEYFFMDWGPTTDNLAMFLFREDGIANITFEFWRENHHNPEEKGVVFVVSMPENELKELLLEAANYLQSINTRHA